MSIYLLTQDVLNVEVSCFANYNTPANPVTIKLPIWLKSEKYRAKIDALRLLKDKTERNAIKATLPAITPSGVFSYRHSSKLITGSHTGLIQFDIDLKDNPLIRNYADLKAQIKKLPFIAYCALSASGLGYWGLVPIANSERHSQHFDALNRVFSHYGIKIDTMPRNVCSLRGYSYDSAPYISERVMVFDLCDKPFKPNFRPFDQSRFSNQNEDVLLKRLINFTQGAGEGNRHEILLRAAIVAGGLVAAGRLNEQNVVYALETVASEWPTFNKSQKTIRDGICYGLVRPLHADDKSPPQQVSFRFDIDNATHYRQPHIVLNGKRFYGEVLTISPCDSYPSAWDE